MPTKLLVLSETTNPVPVRSKLASAEAYQERGVAQMGEKMLGVAELDADEVKRHFAGAIEALGVVVSGGADALGPFHLDTIEVSLSISSEGKVMILGVGASVTAQGSIKLVLKK